MLLADFHLYSEEHVGSLTQYLQDRPHIARIHFCILHRVGLLSPKGAVFDPRFDTLTTVVDVRVPQSTDSAEPSSADRAHLTLEALFAELQRTQSHLCH